MDILAITLLVISFWAYFQIARKFNIVDRPNERSSHTVPTIRGAGILFYLAILFFFVLNDWPHSYFILGLTLVAIISFIDDLYSISRIIRLTLHIGAILLMFLDIGLFEYSWHLILIALIAAAGLLNIFNFMDGINGITGLYSIAVILSLILLNYTIDTFVETRLLGIVLVSLLLFGIYNFRVRAKCFAGDIGSISIGLFILFCIASLLLQSNNLLYLLFILIYAVDGGFTILERIKRRENIFTPHRRHLYQLMVDNRKMSHMKVSAIYAFSQLMINFILIFNEKYLENLYIPYLVIFITISGYFLYKNRILSAAKQ